MAGLFQKFKEHAQAFHKDIRTLEKAFSHPQGFFGTTSSSKEANIILKNEIECVSNFSENMEVLIQEMEESISDNDQLLKKVGSVTDDLHNIKKLLEGCGFAFSVENEVSDSNEENERKNAVNTGTEIDEMQKQHEEKKSPNVKSPNVLHYLRDNIVTDDENCEDRTEKILESNEKYLEANNINLDDIVTPYLNVPRKSLYSGKKHKY